ncbi:hypothetical protein GCM10009840_24810 [Pseudolysinimonas kribbensis]|uniref:Integral membrane bound transporter domain-containing protein n=1 Tax=Pseudolysinimonas kribbensis TaxID=433641 RepID=A0ABQ6KB41_9MICO|nr:FUSC family protein [Pseudolysinimonas kribbensis]GMA96740.1 hypothetical protein GCM10025881_35640 [Pseudolysinimonas kribbensis]
MRLRDRTRDLLALRDSPVRWPIALTAAIAMAAPVAAFTALGHPAWGPVASSGSLLSIYLTARSRRERAWALPLIGAGLLATAAVGALVAAQPLAVLALVGVASILSSIVLALRSVGPPGGIFFALVAGTAGRVAAPASAGGPGLPPPLIVGLVACGCLAGYLAVVAPLIVPGVRARDRVVADELVRRAFRLDEPNRAILPRILIAIVMALVVVLPLGEHRAYWVVLSAMAILQKEPHLRLSAVRGIHRALGTLLGAGAFAIFAIAQPAGYLLAGVLAVLQFVAQELVTRNYGLALLFVTPLALTLAEQGGADPVGVAWERVVDTLLGAGIAGVLIAATALLRRVRRSRSRPAP